MLEMLYEFLVSCDLSEQNQHKDKNKYEKLVKHLPILHKTNEQ